MQRIRRVDHDTLQDDLTVDDPKAYAKPWTGQQIFQLKPGWEITEYVCEDNVNFLDLHKKAIAGPKGLGGSKVLLRSARLKRDRYPTE